MEYVEFTREMKRDYTILIPNMLPMHFDMIAQVMRNYGYNIDVLKTSGHKIPDTGIKYCHNDACYPAVLVVGQFIEALQSGKYDPHKVALIMFQTGGGCRASNYIFLIRKALERSGFGYVPVISLNLLGLEKHSGFPITIRRLLRMIYAIIIGDLIMSLMHQTRPYEREPGSAQALAQTLTRRIANEMAKGHLGFRFVKQKCREVLEAFKMLPIDRSKKKVRVGIVGEIYVKFSPLGNNNLEDFLVSEGAEVSMPGLLDFFMASCCCAMSDYTLLGMKRKQYLVQKTALKVLMNIQKFIIDLLKADGTFRAPTEFSKTMRMIDGYVSEGMKMGEGWLLPAEMLELYHSGVKNIVCAQPFGCLPNHIVGKGMMKPLREKNPGMNIVAIDYDPGATVVNQENRLKLMLANARDNME
ncbi:MAG: 2-hydroxyacyl-CoA dehydratase [Clostridia bacterium]|nr:2-hydroxyacyl-CoA dehydratase [Clostridia bacterium]